MQNSDSVTQKLTLHKYYKAYVALHDTKKSGSTTQKLVPHKYYKAYIALQNMKKSGSATQKSIDKLTPHKTIDNLANVKIADVYNTIAKRLQNDIKHYAALCDKDCNQ